MLMKIMFFNNSYKWPVRYFQSYRKPRLKMIFKEKVSSHIIRIQEIDSIFIGSFGLNRIIEDPGLLHVLLHYLWNVGFLEAGSPVVISKIAAAFPGIIFSRRSQETSSSFLLVKIRACGHPSPITGKKTGIHT